MAKKQPVKKPVSKNDDSVVYKVMIALILACLEVLVTQRVCRAYNSVNLMDTVKQALFVAGFVLLGAALICCGIAVILRKKPNARFVLWLLTANLAFCCIAAFVLYFFWTGPAMLLYFLYFALAVAVSVALLYQPEFFLLFLSSITAAFGFYCLSQVYGSSLPLAILVNVGMALVFLILALVSFLAAKNKGILSLGTARVRVLQLGTALPIYISSLVWLLCQAAGIFLGATFCYVCIFAAIAAAFLFAIYYTVKLK